MKLHQFKFNHTKHKFMYKTSSIIFSFRINIHVPDNNRHLRTPSMKRYLEAEDGDDRSILDT